LIASCISRTEKKLKDLAPPDGGRYQSGCDGAIAGEMNSKAGAEILQGNDAKSKVRDADMYFPSRILDYLSSMEVVDIPEFEGHTCYHLKGTNKWSIINEHFYGTSTGLLIGNRFDSAWRGGARNESAVFKEYKEFDGWLMPTRIDHNQPSGTLTVVVTSVTFDDASDSVLTMPDSVKALLAKKNPSNN
jgi:hypothetical protein